MVITRFNGTILSIKGKLHTEWKAFEENQEVDEVREVDENYEIDDDAGIEAILNYLFGLTEQLIKPNKIFIDIHGELVIPELFTSLKHYDEGETIDDMRELDEYYNLSDGEDFGYLLEYLFDLNFISFNPPDKCYIDKTKELLIPSVSENSII